MKLRRWKFEDILTLSQMEKECFPQEPWSYHALVSSFELDSFVGLIAEDDGEIAGYGGITIAADTADVANVAVAEAYRNSGVGTQIINALCDFAKGRGVEKVFLEVRVSNVPAMMLYLKNGFAGAYTRARYYSDGEDCLVMSKKI